MTFDQIEKALGAHCKTAKCAIERVELHKELVENLKAHPERVRVTSTPVKASPFIQGKR